MRKDQSLGRRYTLKHLSAAIFGLLGWSSAKASTPVTEGGLFASLFLQEGASVQVPLGYYDPETKRYVDAKTKKPLFMPEGEAVVSAASDEKALKATHLTEKKLAELLQQGMFVDARELEKLKAFGQWCTGSTLTTLSTTRCCPIVTDSQTDRVCDDTPNPPPS
jgi:hypothetical protein